MTSSEARVAKADIKAREIETVSRLRENYIDVPTIDLVWLQHCLVVLIEERRTPALLKPQPKN